jgi:3-methylcrotonyl-CoA carboxylase alpha subunit
LRGPGLLVTVGDRVVRAQAHPPHVSLDGEPASVTPIGDDHLLVHWRGRGFRLEPDQPLSLEQASAIGSHGQGRGAGALVAPMPGRIVKLDVELGQHVDANQPLVVLEAMKMEHVVETPRPGTVQRIHVAVGDQVPAGALLLELEADQPA